MPIKIDKPGKEISLMLWSDWLLTILTAGPYALIGSVLLYVLIKGKDIPSDIASMLKTHGAWITVIMLLLWLLGWLVNYFKMREGELIDTLKSMADRYDKTMTDNTKVMAGILEYMRYRHESDTGLKGRDIDAV